MNGKIPVFGAVASAYGFAFGRFLTVLRLSWFWLAIVAGLNIYWGPAIMAALSEGMKAFATGGPEAMQAAMSGVQFESNMLSLVQNLAGIIIFVALVRAVISRDFRDGVPLHILSGMPDLRAIGVLILLMIAVIAAVIGLVIVMAILGAAGGGAVAGIIALILFPVMIWVSLRLSLVLPVAAVESNLGVERSWSLMKGNSFRMFLAILMTFIPFGVAVGMLFSTLLASGPMEPFPQLDQSNPQAFQAAMFTWLGSLFGGMAANWPAYVGASMITTLLSTGLWAGLLGRAYRAVTNMDGEG